MVLHISVNHIANDPNRNCANIDIFTLQTHGSHVSKLRITLCSNYASIGIKSINKKWYWSIFNNYAVVILFRI